MIHKVKYCDLISNVFPYRHSGYNLNSMVELTDNYIKIDFDIYDMCNFIEQKIDIIKDKKEQYITQIFLTLDTNEITEKKKFKIKMKDKYSVQCSIENNVILITYSFDSNYIESLPCQKNCTYVNIKTPAFLIFYSSFKQKI